MAFDAVVDAERAERLPVVGVRTGHDRHPAFALDQRRSIGGRPLVAGDVNALRGRGGRQQAFCSAGDLRRRYVLQPLEHHVLGVIGDHVKAARGKEVQRRLMDFPRIGRQQGDVANAEVRERADGRADAGGGGQSGRLGDLLDQLLLEPLAARGHHRHAGMDDVVDVARGKILHRGDQRIEHVLLEVLLVPVIDVGGGGAHRDAVGRQPVEVVGRGFDHGRAEQADALAPAEGLFGSAHRVDAASSIRRETAVRQCEPFSP